MFSLRICRLLALVTFVTVSQPGLGGSAWSQQVREPPPADQKVEIVIDSLRLFVPLRFLHPDQWSDPPRGFRKPADSVRVLLIGPELDDVSSPASQQCVERVMAGGCKRIVDISISSRSAEWEEQRRVLMGAARPELVGTLHGLDLYRATVPLGLASERAQIYIRATERSGVARFSGSCGGSWDAVVPRSLAEIEQKLIACIFYYDLSDTVRVTISTLDGDLSRWRRLLDRTNELLGSWQTAAN